MKRYIEYLNPTWQENKYALLLFSVVLLIFIAPYFVGGYFGHLVLALFVQILLLTVVYSTLEKAWQWHAIIIYAATIYLILVINAFAESFILELIWTAGSMLFYAGAVAILLKQILSRERVTRETVFAALSEYFLIALVYADAYQIIELVNPNSFQFNAECARCVLDNFTITYFSFTTLTTVGFGEIIPITTQARSIVILEQVTGVLYLAAIVSRLVAGMEVEKN